VSLNKEDEIDECRIASDNFGTELRISSNETHEEFWYTNA